MKTFARLTAMSALLSVGLALAEDTPTDPNIEEAKGVINEFSTQLKGELKAAMTEGGPIQAIGFCKERAPKIAAEVSAKTGWQLGRTSLKTRNTELNAPDAWEQQVLNEFEKRKAAGEDVAAMAYSEVVETANGKEFRFMKAIPVGEPCLACHGREITPEIAAAIEKNYPKDQAVGYQLGDLRGAFSLSKPL